MNRWRDWWDQAQRDLGHAERSVVAGDHEWAAFAGQQAAEKAVKALIMAHGGEPWGHLVTALIDAVPPTVGPDTEAQDAARRLDKHYIPARYPNGFAESFPGNLYTRGEAEGAVADARTIIAFCRRHLP